MQADAGRVLADLSAVQGECVSDRWRVFSDKRLVRVLSWD